jgi:hypothetical protein
MVDQCCNCTNVGTDKFGIEVIKHPDNMSILDMTQPKTAFQLFEPELKAYESVLRFNKSVYLPPHNPYMLSRAVMNTGRQVCTCTCAAEIHDFSSVTTVAHVGWIFLRPFLSDLAVCHLKSFGAHESHTVSCKKAMMMTPLTTIEHRG